jgi:predicted patatin/cPLA2 family phospholipase
MIRNIYLKLVFLGIILLSAKCSNSKKNEKCFVIALEGGGDKGAYQAGVLKGMMSKLEKEKRSYDIVTGISVGSINAATLITFEKGQELEAADYLVTAWKNIKGNKEIYVEWPYGIAQGIFFKQSIYDASPLKDKLSSTLKDRKISRKFVIGATKARDGNYATFTEEDVKTIDDLINVVRSSAAIPVLFPSILHKGEYYMDGGVINNVDIFSGINKCLEMGYEEKDITVDIIRCKPNKEVEEVEDISKFNSFKMLMRYINISTKNLFMNTIESVLRNFPNVNYRYLIYPVKELPSSFPPLNFTEEEVEKMINIGIEDGENVVTNHGDSGNVRSLYKEFMDSKKSKQKRKPKNLKSIKFLD